MKQSSFLNSGSGILPIRINKRSKTPRKGRRSSFVQASSDEGRILAVNRSASLLPKFLTQKYLIQKILYERGDGEVVIAKVINRMKPQFGEFVIKVIKGMDGVIRRKEAKQEIYMLKLLRLVLQGVGCQGYIGSQIYEDYIIIESELYDTDLLEVVTKSPSGKLNEDQARSYFKQILLILKQLHLFGIAHRDIKPDNIFVKGNQIVFADFAHSIRDGTKVKHDNCGTLNYSPPEVRERVKNHVGVHVDIFQLGVTLFAMISGRLPFTKMPTEEMIWEVVSMLDVSSDLKRLLMKLMQCEAESRPNVEELFQDPWVLSDDDDEDSDENSDSDSDSDTHSYGGRHFSIGESPNEQYCLAGTIGDGSGLGINVKKRRPKHRLRSFTFT